MSAAVITDGGNSGSASPTLADAFTPDASPASETPAQTHDATAAAQPAAAEGQTPQQAEDKREPFIPRQRFDEVNGQLSELRKWKEQRAWAEQLDQQTFQQMAEWYQKANANPLEFATSLIQELQQHPTYGQQLRSLAARTLAQGRSADPNALPQPDVQITDAQGNVVGQTYSDKQLAVREAWLMNQILARIDEKFSPVTKTVEQITAERSQLEAKQKAKETFETLKQLPGFDEHQGEIAKRLSALKLPDDPVVIAMAAKAIYADVAMPSLTKKAQSDLLDTLQHKAAASTSVNPGNATPATSKQYKSFTDLPAEAWK